MDFALEKDLDAQNKKTMTRQIRSPESSEYNPSVKIN